MIIGYSRVSSQQQNLQMQLDALEKYGCEMIYKEKVSGMKDDRPELKKMIKYARKGDTIVVYKLDRLGRSTKKLLSLIEDFEQKGIKLVSIRDSIDTNSAIGKAMLRMLMVLAEMERDLIIERTNSGLESARARGRYGGRPKVDKNRISMALDMYTMNQFSIKEITEINGISRSTLYKYINNNKS